MHHPIDQYNRKMKQQHFRTYLSAWQRKLHKEISDIAVSLCLPETFEFIGDYEDIITQQEQSTTEEGHNTAEEVMSKDNKEIFEEDHKHFSKGESPNLSQLFIGKDRLGMINADVPSLCHR
jgi:hypothetical protein